jgi:hypothetical protein
MTWTKVVSIIAGVFFPIAALLGWGHSDLSRDIDRVESAVSELRTDLSGFKDQSYDRFAEIQKEVGETRVEIANVRAELVSQRSAPRDQAKP